PRSDCRPRHAQHQGSRPGLRRWPPRTSEAHPPGNGGDRRSRDNHREILTEMDSILEDLLLAAGACRVTLRQDLPGEYAFPVTHEALAPGVPSLVDERTVDLRKQPVVRDLMRGHQVVQPDCRAAFDDPAFQRMLERYGGLAAPIVTPSILGDGLAPLVSFHPLGAPRSRTHDQAAACT